MCELNVVQVYLEQNILNFPAIDCENFPDHLEDILLVAGGVVYKCNVNRTASSPMSRIRILADQGASNNYNDWMNEHYNVGDVIKFRSMYDTQGIVRVLIVENN
jgi:hypothetical protein